MSGIIKCGTVSFIFSKKEASSEKPSLGFTPDAGKISNMSGFANNINNKIATKKFGNEYNPKSTTEEILSKRPPLFFAALTPMGMLTKYAIKTDVSVKKSDHPIL